MWEIDKEQGQSTTNPPPDPTDPTAFLQQFLATPGVSQQQMMEQQRQAQTRLSELMGPEPEPPMRASKAQRIGAGIGDIFGALAQIERGIHPTTGSGARRERLPEGNFLTNRLGELNAMDEAERQRYEQGRYQRGVIKAQMYPGMVKALSAVDEALEERKIKAATALVQAQSKEAAAAARTDNFMKRVSGIFIDPDTGKIARDSQGNIDPERKQAFISAFVEQYPDKTEKDAMTYMYAALGQDRAMMEAMGSKGAYADLARARQADIPVQQGLRQTSARTKFESDEAGRLLKNILSNVNTKHLSFEEQQKLIDDGMKKIKGRADSYFGGGEAAGAPVSAAPPVSDYTDYLAQEGPTPTAAEVATAKKAELDAKAAKVTPEGAFSKEERDKLIALGYALKANDVKAMRVLLESYGVDTSDTPDNALADSVETILETMANALAAAKGKR